MTENILVGRADLTATLELTNAAVVLENAFKGKKGAVAIDLFIFLKKSDDGDTFFKRLSVDQRALLNKNPALLGDPERLFQAIKGMNKVEAGKGLAQIEQAHKDQAVENGPPAERLTRTGTNQNKPMHLTIT